MSLRPFNFDAQKLYQMFSWFSEIYSHLGADNYSAGEWVAGLSGISGSPTVAARYHRWGQLLSFTITITGTHTAAAAQISGLPVAALLTGACNVYDIASKTIIASGIISGGGNVIGLSNYTAAAVVISGSVHVSGI
jgi:hypothetical protein